MNYSTPQHYYLRSTWQQPALFNSATEWIRNNFNDKEAHWDYELGRSWIDNAVYPAAVFFKNEEDYLVFKIKFGKLLNR